jgi:hypothetical protein
MSRSPDIVRVTAWCIVWLALMASLPVGAARAEHFESPDSAVEGGREALDQWSSYPWYDAETDGVRRIPLSAQQSSWDWSWLYDLFRVLGWIAIALLVGGFAYLIFRFFVDRETTVSQMAVESASEETDDRLRVESLPFKVDAPGTDLLGEAQRHYQRGEFDRAIVYLYSYQLVQLDKHQWIRLARGKTNRQYLREIRSDRSLRALLAETMIAFEEAFFGQHHLNRSRFESSWNRLSQFQQLVVQAT